MLWAAVRDHCLALSLPAKVQAVSTPRATSYPLSALLSHNHVLLSASRLLTPGKTYETIGSCLSATRASPPRIRAWHSRGMLCRRRAVNVSAPTLSAAPGPNAQD